MKVPRFVQRFVDWPEWHKVPGFDRHWTVWYAGKQVGEMFLGKSGWYFGIMDDVVVRSKNIYNVELVLAGRAVNGGV